MDKYFELDRTIQVYLGQLRSEGYIVSEKKTSCRRNCFLASQGQNEHILILPEGVTKFNGTLKKDKQSEAHQALQELRGKLRVCGGYDLKTTSYMFTGCKYLSEIDLSSMISAKSKSALHMFSDCDNLERVDMRGFHTPEVTNMEYMFSNCRLLKSVDMSQRDVRNVTSFKFMFFHCYSLKSVTFGGNAHTSRLEDVSFMFGFCFSLEAVNLGGITAEYINYMTGMFYRCRALRTIDIRSFRLIPEYLDVTKMFYDCWFDTIYVDIRSQFGYRLINADEAFSEDTYPNIKVAGDFILKVIR